VSARLLFSASLALLFSFPVLGAGPLIQGPQKNLPRLEAEQEIRITVWNILKGEREIFKEEFSHLAKYSDLMLLQEALLTPGQQKLFSSFREFRWVMADAWEKSGAPTGAAALSRYKITRPQALLSRDGQPISNTPKSSVLFEIPIQDGRTLLVVSTHAINFTLNGPFQRQIETLGQIIAAHQGPVLWAGDFNTWRGSRRDLLTSTAKAAGLSEIPFDPDPRHLVLDHAFVRDLTVESAAIMDAFEGSDHWPLYLEVRLKKSGASE